jgi:hypothetical protein
MIMEATAVRSCKLVARTANRWVRALVLFSVTGLLSGCSNPLGTMPDLANLPDKMLNKDQQQTKINEMAAKGQAHQSEAAKDIENQK